MKKIISILLCITFLFLLSSCNPKESLLSSISEINEDESNESGIDEIGYRLPYNRTDSLNPYEATSEINKHLAKLIYDSLYTVDDKFNAVALMASSFKVNDTTLTVELKANLKFTDGVAVTGRDVVYSFEKAKNSPEYSSYLSNIESVTYNSNTIIFTLKRYNENENANLVFPIIEFDTDESEDTDLSNIVPIGSGRYYIKDDGTNKNLYVNNSRLGGYYPKYNIIGLTSVAENSSVQSLFSLGEIDAYTNDYSDGDFTNYSGDGIDYNMTNLVFLGINSDSSIMQNPKVRRAVALSLNRVDLASVSFASHAVATSTPFHPDSDITDSCTIPTLKQNYDNTSALLDEAGYDTINSSNIRINEKGNSLSITLLVNKDNNFKVSLARSIEQSLEKAKFSVTIKEYSYSKYIEAIENGSYTMYIGEVKLGNNFDLSRFFADGGSLSYGIDTSGDCSAVYFKYLSGNATLQNFIDAFADELPFIPIAFRKGIIIKSSKISTKLTPTSQDCYENIDEWTVS